MNAGPAYTYSASVVGVYDADTITLDVDLGFSITAHKQAFRLSGIDAPEMATPQGKVARDFLRSLLPVGTRVVVSTKKDKKEKYGRYLAVILLDGQDLNARLVADGYAKPYMSATLHATPSEAETLRAEVARLREELGNLISPCGEFACEQHPELPWPHDDCPGPGFPASGRILHLCHQRDKARQETREVKIQCDDAIKALEADAVAKSLQRINELNAMLKEPFVTVPSSEYEALRQLQFYARDPQAQMETRHFLMEIRQLDEAGKSGPVKSNLILESHTAALARCGRLEKALKKLEHASTVVANKGARTGPQWTRLTVGLLAARKALAQSPEKGSEAVCQTCNGRGEIGGVAGQTPEQYDERSEPCPDCAAPSQPINPKP